MPLPLGMGSVGPALGEAAAKPAAEPLDDGLDTAKAEAGKALASAIKSNDGKAICEAVKTIMDLEYEE
jgi:hypothetical protein